MAVEYIYHPASVCEILRTYPSLKNALTDPILEGQQSLGYPRCRKTARQVHRILANQHYPHLVELLTSLENCLASGWRQPSLLRTMSQKEFDSSLSELRIAEHFLRKGFAVKNLPGGQDPVPDMLVELGSLSASVEVYTPRDWDGLDYFTEDLRLGIEYLDVGWDFQFEIDISHCAQRSLFFDPWQFSDANERPRERWKKVRNILSAVKDNLGRCATSGSECATKLDQKDLDCNVTVRLTGLQPGGAECPARGGSFSVPTITGYAPEGMFDRLVRRRITTKIQRRQAASVPGRHLRMLAVDISGLAYWHQFAHPYYLRTFGRTVDGVLGQGASDIDVVVFFSAKSGRSSEMSVPLLFREPSVSDATVATLFDLGRRTDALSRKVLVCHPETSTM